MDPLFSFDLGVRVKDIVSTLSGIVTARCEYLNGCKRYLVEVPKLKESGEPVGNWWVDEEQLVEIDSGVRKDLDIVAASSPRSFAPGGPRDNEPPSMTERG